jgi:16S rRNA (uracil1498-N3)-methyltransferase
MRLHRIFYPFTESLNQSCLIENEKAHYLRNVLRLKVDQQFRIFNHQSEEYLATITAISKKDLTIELIESIPVIAKSKLNITLVQSLSKGERMDYTVQKATELGIAKIQPITSEFCEVRLKGSRLEKKIYHWQGIATSACEQSFQCEIPEILNPISISDYSNKQRIGLYLEPEETLTIGQIAQQQMRQFDIAVGPEGGWSPTDLKLLKQSGLQGIQFGPRILRTETVAPAILASIHSLWGDFI